MRPVWILTATLMTCVALTGQTGSAYAAEGKIRTATSCRDLIRKYQSLGSSRSGLGQGGPNSTQKYYANLAKTYSQLAKSGPSQLRTAFKHLVQYMTKLAQLDFSNPSTAQQLGQQLATSAQTLQPDIQKITAYFASVCHYTSATT